MWKCLSDPPSKDNFAKFIFYTDAALCIYLVILGILSTDHRINHENRDIFNTSNAAIVVLMTFEHALRLWSCTVVEEYKDRVWGRLKWQMTILALVQTEYRALFVLAASLSQFAHPPCTRWILW